MNYQIVIKIKSDTNYNQADFAEMESEMRKFLRKVDWTDDVIFKESIISVEMMQTPEKGAE